MPDPLERWVLAHGLLDLQKEFYDHASNYVEPYEAEELARMCMISLRQKLESREESKE